MAGEYDREDRERREAQIKAESGDWQSSALMVESALLAEKKQRGRPWLPGQSGNPAGRPTKARELAILDAISNAFSPEQINDHLTTAMNIAIEQNSARSIVAILEFMADRTVGKPVQRIETNNNGLQNILDMLGPAE